jgi:hypothetical protein
MKEIAALAFAIIFSVGCGGAGAWGKDSSGPLVKAIDNHGRFTACDNGTVKDTRTGLMWAAKDNGGPISWDDAKKYCRDYRAGGYSDWRMPTQEELTALYDPEITNPLPPAEGCKGGYHITELIHISCCCIWSWDGMSEVETFFHFGLGPKGWRDQSLSDNPRALPVRYVR